LTFGERVTLRQCAGLLLGALGLATVGLHVDASLTLLGLALVLAAATCWAASNLVVKFAARRAAAEATAAAPRLDMLAFVVWSNGFACLAMLPVMFMTVGAQQAGQQLLGATPVAWAAGLWQALGNTLIGFVAWSAMLARYPAAVVTPWALLVPVFGMTASVWLLGEPLPAWKIVAGVLVLAGIAVTTWPRRMPA
jgi:O-acetylserine/cysteine efflux transporter